MPSLCGGCNSATSVTQPVTPHSMWGWSGAASMSPEVLIVPSPSPMGVKSPGVPPALRESDQDLYVIASPVISSPRRHSRPVRSEVDTLVVQSPDPRPSRAHTQTSPSIPPLRTEPEPQESPRPSTAPPFQPAPLPSPASVVATQESVKDWLPCGGTDGIPRKSSSSIPRQAQLGSPPTGWYGEGSGGLKSFVKGLPGSLDVLGWYSKDDSRRIEQMLRSPPPEGYSVKPSSLHAVRLVAEEIEENPRQLGSDVILALSDPKAGVLPALMPLVWALRDAINELDAGPGVLYRGVGHGLRLDRTYSVGQYVRWTDMCGVTSRLRLAERAVEPMGTLCVLRVSRHAPVWRFISDASRRVCLIPINSLFRVVSVSVPSELHLLDVTYGVVVLEQVNEDGCPADPGLGARRDLCLLGKGGAADVQLSTFVPPPAFLLGHVTATVDILIRDVLSIEGRMAVGILGEPGSGKTTLGLWICRQVALQRGKWFPVHVELSRVEGLGEPGALMRHVQKKLYLSDAQLTELTCGSWRVVFVLDGYDEIPGLGEKGVNVGEMERLGSIPGVKVVTLCKTGVVDGGDVGMRRAFGLLVRDELRASLIRLNGFQQEDVERFVRGLEGNDTGGKAYAGLRRHTMLKADDVIGVLRKRESLWQLASSPVVLRFMLLVMDLLDRDDVVISRYYVYKSAFETAFWKVQAGGALPDGVTWQQCMKACGRLALELHERGGRANWVDVYKAVGWAGDLWLLPLRVEPESGEKAYVSFRHRTVEEFFIAWSVERDVQAIKRVSCANEGVTEFFGDMLGQGVSLEKKVTGTDANAAVVLMKLGEMREVQGKYEHAAASFERALHLREAELGPFHPLTGSSLHALARSRQSMGDLGSASELLERAVGILGRSRGADHPDTVSAEVNLGLVMECRGRLDEAAGYYTHALNAIAEQVGQTHPHTAIMLNNLGNVRRAEGKLIQSSDLYQQALEARECSLGEGHPLVAGTLNNIGSVYRMQGKLEAAAGFHLRARDICVRSLGRDHPETAVALCNLGAVRLAQGLLDSAAGDFETALRIFGNSVGSDSAACATALTHLATIRCSQGRIGEAEQLCERALSTQESLVGESHPCLSGILCCMGRIRKEQGNTKEAGDLYERALMLCEGLPQGTDGMPSLVTVLTALGSVRRSQGRLEEAAEVLTRAIRLEEETGDTGDRPSLRMSLTMLAEVRESQKRQKDAAALYERVQHLCLEHKGEHHIDTATAMCRLADSLERQDEHPRAARLYERSVEICDLLLGSGHPDTFSALCRLGDARHAMGEAEAAGSAYERALQTLSAKPGRNKLVTAEVLYHLALVRGDQQRLDEAGELFERSLTLREEELGKTSPDVGTTLAAFGLLRQRQGRNEDALALLERALNISKKEMGAGHCTTGVILNNVATVRRALGDMSTAEEDLARVVEIFESSLGFDDKLTRAAARNLAAVRRSTHASLPHSELEQERRRRKEREQLKVATNLHDEGKSKMQEELYDEASTLLEDSLASIERILWEGHPSTAPILMSLGELRQRQRQWLAAAVLYERALDIYERDVGPNDSSTATAHVNLGTVRQSLEQHELAASHFTRAVEGYEASVGSDHVFTGTALSNLGAVRQAQGKYVDASMLHHRALAIHENEYGRGHPATVTTLINYGAATHGEGKLSESAALYERALSAKETELGTGHVLLCPILNSLGLVRQEQGNLEDASACLKRSLIITETEVGPLHPDAWISLVNLGSVRMNQEQLSAAGELFRRALRICVRDLGETHPSTVVTRGWLEHLQLRCGGGIQSSPSASPKASAAPEPSGPPIPPPLCIPSPPGDWADGRDDGLLEFVRSLKRVDGFGEEAAARMEGQLRGVVREKWSECSGRIHRRGFDGVQLNSAYVEGNDVQLNGEVNTVLKEGTPDAMRPFFPLIWTLREVTDEKDAGRAILFRGERGARRDLSHKVGEYIRWINVSPLTTCLLEAEKAARPTGARGSWGTVCVLYTRHHTRVGYMTKEGDCLIPLNTLLRVTSVVPSEEMCHFGVRYGLVLMEEVDEDGKRKSEGLHYRRQYVHGIYGPNGLFSTNLSTFVPQRSRVRGKPSCAADETLLELLSAGGKMGIGIVGDTGSGKSTLGMWIAAETLKLGPRFFPVYVDLSKVDDIGDRGALLTDVKSQLQLTEDEMRELMSGEWRVVFVLDGYDKLSGVAEKGINVGETGGLCSIPGVKVVTLCRDGVVEGGERAMRKAFGVNSNGELQAVLIRIEGLGEFDIERVLSMMQGNDARGRKHAGLRRFTPLIADEVMSALRKRRDIMDLAANPTVLRVLLHSISFLLGQDGSRITRYELYRRGLEDMFTKMERERLFEEGVGVSDCMDACGRLAMALHERRGPVGLSDVASVMNWEGDLSVLPVKVERNQVGKLWVSFVHRSIEEFFVAWCVERQVCEVRRVGVVDPANHGVVRFLWDVMGESSRLEARVSGSDARAAEIVGKLGEIREAQGMFQLAASLHCRALDVRERVLGRSHVLTAATLQNLGGVRLSQGQLKEASMLLERAVHVLEIEFGPQHHQTASAINDLGRVKLAEGDREQASRLMSGALRTCEEQLGELHPQTATTLNNLAVVLQSQGRLENAAALLRRALETRLCTLGDLHPDTATAMSNLASVFHAMGKTSDAAGMYERALAIEQWVLREGHPSMASTLFSLANLRRTQGRHNASAPLYERAVQICEKEMGEAHPATAKALMGLASSLLAQGRRYHAVDILERVVRLRENYLGESHPETKAARASLVEARRSMQLAEGLRRVGMSKST